MKIDVTQEDGYYVVKLEGFLDTNSSPELQTKIEALSSEKREKPGFNIVFNLAEVSFVSSAGLRVLLMAKKMTDRQNGKMVVINVQDSIREVFDMTGFSKILNLK